MGHSIRKREVQTHYHLRLLMYLPSVKYEESVVQSEKMKGGKKIFWREKRIHKIVEVENDHYANIYFSAKDHEEAKEKSRVFILEHKPKDYSVDYGLMIFNGRAIEQGVKHYVKDCD